MQASALMAGSVSPGSFTTDFYLSDDELIAVFPIGRGLLKVMRFNHDGTLDPTFGGDGVHNYYAFSTSNPQVTVDADGRIDRGGEPFLPAECGPSDRAVVAAWIRRSPITGKRRSGRAWTEYVQF